MLRVRSSVCMLDDDDDDEAQFRRTAVGSDCQVCQPWTLPALVDSLSQEQV